MKTVEIPRILTLQWLRAKYAKQEVTPQQVIETILHRVNEDRLMNIWITPPTLEGVRPYFDRLLAVDPADFPLWGVPFAIKDNIDLAGVPTTAGCSDYAYTPGEHAAVVERLIAAGAIPLGKTNLDQFATGLVGTRSPYGETFNALRPELISGGSSSGSAVAVARGHAAFALGTDTAGSGRVPAALNRLVGFKPSFGAWPVKGVVPACASLDCVTVFAHSLEDTLAVDGAARGVHGSDPWSRSIPQPRPKRPAKLILPKEQPEFFGPFGDAYSKAWNAAIERLLHLNIAVEYIDCSMFAEAAAILYGGPLVAERWAGLGGFIELHPGAAFPVTEQVLRSGAAAEYDAASVFKALHKLQAYKLAAGKLLEDAVLVMPTAGGTWTRDQVRVNPIGANSDMGRYTNHCNLLDLCAVAVPAGDAAADLPFGITIFALAANESFICGTADAFAGLSVEPVKLAGAMESMEAVGPMLLMGTVESTARMESTEEVESVESVKLAGAMESLESMQLTARMESTEEVESVESVKLADSMESTETMVTPANLKGIGQTGQAAIIETGGGVEVTTPAHADKTTTLVAVCGLHMRGFPLEKQMIACGAKFVREAATAAAYKLYKLPTVPAKPGLIKRQTGGASIQLEIWEMPLESFGSFAASIPAPLGIGKVELDDGTEIPGFVCEAYAAVGAQDVTASGGWRYIC